MDKGLFHLSGFMDLYAKARREYGRLSVDPTVDNIFNFLCTINHLTDWALQDKTLSEEAHEKAKAMQARAGDLNKGGDKSYPLYTIRLLCNSGKHFELSKETPVSQSIAPIDEHSHVGCFGITMHDGMPYNYGLEHDGHDVALSFVARAAMLIWEEYVENFVDPPVKVTNYASN